MKVKVTITHITGETVTLRVVINQRPVGYLTVAVDDAAELLVRLTTDPIANDVEAALSAAHLVLEQATKELTR